MPSFTICKFTFSSRSAVNTSACFETRSLDFICDFAISPWQPARALRSVADTLSVHKKRAHSLISCTPTKINGAQNAIAQQLYTNQLSDLERSFNAQAATTGGLTNISAQLANCCCENRQATNDVKYTIATEACNTRAANTANTQAILDKLCALELDGYKRENDQLRTQLNMANLAASQTAQTAELRANNATVANQLVSELRSCPIPSQPVYGNQPIFTCQAQSNCGCGCGAF